MSKATFTLSAFGDEIAVDLEEQLRVLGELQIDHLDLRQAWGKNVLHLDDREVDRVAALCADTGVSISSIGSPIGKSPIVDPIEKEAGNLARIFEICEKVGARNVRIFSFYPPDISTNAHYDEYVEESTSRLIRLAEMAQREGFTLMLENEKAIVGDTVDRCRAIVSTVDSPHLSFLWDPANFIQVGEEKPTDRGWSRLGSYVVDCVHIKDALLADGSITLAGEGDGQVRELLAKLDEGGFRGFLSLEPHLVAARHSSGFSGAEGMAMAVKALRELLAELGEG